MLKMKNILLISLILIVFSCLGGCFAAENQSETSYTNYNMEFSSSEIVKAEINNNITSIEAEESKVKDPNRNNNDNTTYSVENKGKKAASGNNNNNNNVTALQNGVNETAHVGPRNNRTNLFPITVDNETYYGFCSDGIDVSEPSNNNYNVTIDISKVPKKVLDIIVKYFRYNNTYLFNQYIQIAIYKVIGNISGFPPNASPEQRAIIQKIVDDQTGVNGNTYIDENGVKYIFDIIYLTSNETTTTNKTIQNIIGFKYRTEEIPEEEEPEISTSARNNATGNRDGISNGTVTIIDTVTYKNLTPGQEYTITGYLMYKNGSYVLINGNRVNVTKTFTPTNANDTIELIFTFDATGLGNVSVVVFEFLTDSNGTNITNHTDLNDPNQTINFTEPPEEEPEKPIIGTNAKNKDTGNRNAVSKGKITIIDTVTYKNLTHGKEYIITGYLMYKNGNYVTINGEKVTVTKTFTPTTANGSIDLEFTFNATGLGNVSLVVFEYLTDSNGTEIANHTDLNDPNQTITFTEPPTDPEEPSNPDEPGTPDEPDEPDEPDFPDLPFFPDFPDYPDEPDEQNNPKINIPKTSAEMKPTGMPIIVIILVLLASLGLINRKK